MKRLAPLILCLMACSPFSAGPVERLPASWPIDRADGLDEALATQVEALAGAFLQEQGVPGMALALVDDGVVVYAGGLGWADIGAERALDRHTPVLLSSVSKTFVGVAAAQARAAGEVSWETPVSDLVGFSVAHPGSELSITLGHLLTHHSGIVDTAAYGAAYAEGDPTIGLAEFEQGYLSSGGRWWRRGNFGDAPGASFSYSNVGMALAGLALGEVAGISFAERVRRDILEPSGMADSDYFLSDLERAPALPYQRAPGGVRALPQYGYPTYPDGMMRASAVDLGAYMAALAPGSTLLMSVSEREAMFQVDPALGTDEEGQAIAWARRALDGVDMMGHNGGDYGSLAELWIDPQTGDGLALALNGTPAAWSPVIALEQELIRLVR